MPAPTHRTIITSEHKAYANPLLALVEPAVTALMAAETAHLNKVLQDLINRNHEAGGHVYAYLHRGRIWTLAEAKFIRGVKIPTLHASLVTEANALLELTEKLEADTKRLTQGLSVVVSKCRTKQHLRDALPDVLVNAIPELRGLERMRDEGWLLADQPTLKGQYDKAIEIALYYTANRLIY